MRGCIPHRGTYRFAKPERRTLKLNVSQICTSVKNTTSPEMLYFQKYAWRARALPAIDSPEELTVLRQICYLDLNGMGREYGPPKSQKEADVRRRMGWEGNRRGNRGQRRGVREDTSTSSSRIRLWTDVSTTVAMQRPRLT